MHLQFQDYRNVPPDCFHSKDKNHVTFAYESLATRLLLTKWNGILHYVYCIYYTDVELFVSFGK